jgi:hypothetical protein
VPHLDIKCPTKIKRLDVKKRIGISKQAVDIYFSKGPHSFAIKQKNNNFFCNITFQAYPKQ